MSEDIQFRITRLCAALGQTETRDLSTLKPTVFNSKEGFGYHQDFRGDMDEADLANAATLTFGSVTSIVGHLRAWAGKDQIKKEKIDTVYKNSVAIRVLFDLNNHEKHGGKLRDKGESGLSPRLLRFDRRMILSTGGGTSIAITMSPKGEIVALGDGTATVTITGDIVDGNGAPLRDLHEYVQTAVTELEQLLRDLGLLK